MLTNIGIYCCYPLTVGPASGPISGVRLHYVFRAPFVLIAVAALLARLPKGRVARAAPLALAMSSTQFPCSHSPLAWPRLSSYTGLLGSADARWSGNYR